MAFEWMSVGDGREATVDGVVYRVAPGGSAKFFLAWMDGEVLGQSPTLSGAQLLCAHKAAERKDDH